MCFAVFLLCWFVSIRGLGTKALSQKLSDDYSAYYPVEGSVSQKMCIRDRFCGEILPPPGCAGIKPTRRCPGPGCGGF